MHVIAERPVVMMIIDQPDRIHAFVPEISHLVTRGLIVTDTVDIVVPADEPDSDLLPQ